MTKEKSITGGEVEAWLDELSAFLYRLAQWGNQDGLEAECLGQGMPALRDYLASSGRIRGEWRPISEAPRDGALILAYIPYGGGFIMQTYMKHDRSHSYWWCEGGEVCPSHWMPLPQPPEVKK